MTTVWDSEIHINQEIAEKLLEKQFKDKVKVEYLGHGWDNLVFLVNQEFVFRFPRRNVAVDLIEREWKVLPIIKDKLNLQIPLPIFQGLPSDEYQYPFIGYQYLKGTTACSLNLSSKEKLSFVKPLAKFLKDLHSIPLEDIILTDKCDDILLKLQFEKAIPDTTSVLEKVLDLGIYDCKKHLEIVKTLKHLKGTKQKNLVHGDFYLRHFLVNPKNELEAIIDWGSVHIGSSACDLEILFNFIPYDGIQEFIDIYGEINEVLASQSLFRAISHSSACVLYGHEIGDKNLFKEAVIGMDFILKNSEYFNLNKN